MQKLRYGLGENSRFSACHPMVNFIFYAFVIGITMFSMSPAFLAATLCFSWAYTVLLKGVPGIKTNLLFTIPLFLIMAVVNTLFTHLLQGTSRKIPPSTMKENWKPGTLIYPLPAVLVSCGACSATQSG